MKTSITRRFTFESAHHLPNHPGKCKTPHGHSYKLLATVRGDGVDPLTGYFMDFDTLKRIVNEKAIDRLDHRDLNQVFKVPSAEIIAEWIYKRITEGLAELRPGLELTRVRLYETENCYVDVRG